MKRDFRLISASVANLKQGMGVNPGARTGMSRSNDELSSQAQSRQQQPVNVSNNTAPVPPPRRSRPNHAATVIVRSKPSRQPLPQETSPSPILASATLSRGTRVFGIGLHEVRLKTRAGVPVVLKKLTKAIEAFGGFATEGVFRWDVLLSFIFFLSNGFILCTLQNSRK
jgi:hypothetical protein